MIAYLEGQDTTVEVPDDISEADLEKLPENFSAQLQPKEESANPGERWTQNFHESFVKPLLPILAGPDILAQKAVQTPQGAAFGAKALEGLTFGASKPLTAELEQVIKDHPVYSTAGALAGGTGSLLATGGFLGLTRLPDLASRAGQAAVPLVESAPRFIVPAIKTASTFGTKKFIEETVKSLQENRLDIVDFGSSVIKDTALGGLLGGISGFSNAVTAISSAAGLGFLSTKIDGGDNSEALLNGSIWAVFEAIGSFGRQERLRREGLKAVADSIGQYVKSKDPSVPDALAKAVGETIVTQETAKFGGVEAIVKSQEDTLKAIESINQKIRSGKIKEPIKPQEVTKPAELTQERPKQAPPPPEPIKPEIPPETALKVPGPIPSFGARPEPTQTTIFGTEEPVSGRPLARPEEQPGLFSAQAKPQFEVPEKKIKYDRRGIPILNPQDVVAEIDLPTGGKAQIMHQQVLDEAQGLLEDAKTYREGRDALGEFVIANGGIRGFKSGVEGEEFQRVPIHFRGQTPADEMAQMAFDAGFLEEPSADLLRNRLAEIPARGKEPRLGDFYALAQRNLEQYYSSPQPIESNTGELEFPEETTPQSVLDEMLLESKVRKPSGPASTGAIGIDAFSPRESLETKEARQSFKLFDRVLEIVQKYAGRVGEKYTPRGAIGSFNPKTKNIRINSLNNVSTATHEIVHFLDNKHHFINPLMATTGLSKTGNPIYDSKWRKLRKELTNIYLEYYPGASKTHKLKVRLEEGTAVFFQQYAHNPKIIEEKYPELTQAMLGDRAEFSLGDKQPLNTPEEWKASVPEFKELLSDVQKIIGDYQELDPNQKIGARVVNTVRQEKKTLPFMSKADYLKQETIDDVYPIKRFAEAFGKAGTLADPADWVRVFNNVNSILYNNLRGKLGVVSKATGIFSTRHGFWSFKNGRPYRVTDKNWRDLEAGLNKAGIKEQFRNWLIARDQHFLNLELDKKKELAKEAAQALQDGEVEGVPMSSIDAANLKSIIEDYRSLKDQLDRNKIPRDLATKAYEADKDIMGPYAKLFDSFTRAMVELASDPAVGLVTKKQAAEYLAREGYAPLKRDVFDEIVAGESPTIGAGGKGKPSSFKQRTGSELPIIDPLYTFPHDMAEVFRKSLKQMVVNKIADIFDQNPESGLAEPQKVQPVLDQRTGKVFYPQDRDPNILMARTPEGKRRPYLVNAEIKKIVEELLDYRSADILARILRGSSRLFTASTTGLFPPFAAMNVVADQIQAASNSQHQTIPFFDAVKVLRRALLDNDSLEAKYAAEYLAMGGERQSMVNALSLPPEEFDQWLLHEKTGIQHLIDWMDTGSEILGFPSKVSELSTRMVEYIRSRMVGKEYVNALEDAGTITGSFHHQGRLAFKPAGKVKGQVTALSSLVRGIPFFNAGIQALSVGVESLKGSRGKNVQNRAIFVALASMAAAVASSYWTMKKATKKQKQLFTELQSTELASYIWLPASDGEHLMKIKAHGPQMGIATIINMALWESMAGVDYSIGDYVAGGTAWLPDQANVTDPSRLFFSWLPQLIKPWIEYFTGLKTWPNVRPMESETLKQEEPRLRFKEDTAAYAKWLGDKLNISPIKIDYLIESLIGRGSRPFLGKEIKNPFMREWYFTAGRTIQDYYDQRESTNQLWDSLTKRKRPFSDEEMRKVYEQKAQVKRIDILLKQYRTLELNKVSDARLEELRDSILNEISMFRQAVK